MKSLCDVSVRACNDNANLSALIIGFARFLQICDVPVIHSTT